MCITFHILLSPGFDFDSISSEMNGFNQNLLHPLHSMAALYKMQRNTAQSCPGKARGKMKGRILASNWVLTVEL